MRTEVAQHNSPNWFHPIFFIFWPVFSFIYSLFNLHLKWARVSIVLFYGLCGYFYPFSFSDDVDAVRHAESFKLVATLPFTVFFERVATLYVSDVYKPDLAQPLIELVVSRFTSDYRIYFVVLGLIFGYLLMQLIKLLNIEVREGRNGFFMLLLLFFIIVLLPPYRIAGFRQMAGTLFICIGIYQVLVNNKKKYHYLVIASCLVHFGFFAIMPFYILYFFVGERYWIYFGLIVVAFLLRDQAATLFGDASTDLQGQLGQRVRGYTSERYLEDTAVAQQRQLGIISNQLPFTAYFFFVILFYFFIRGHLQASQPSRVLYAMVLSLFIFLAFISDLHNTLVRFSMPIIILSTALTIMVMAESKRYLFVIRVLLLLVIGINAVVMFRKAIEYTGVQVLVPNVVMGFFLDTDASILDLIM